MSLSEQDSETHFHLGPKAFPEVSQGRVSTLLSVPVFQLKTLTHILTDMENGEEIDLPEELEGEDGEAIVYRNFVGILQSADDSEGRLRAATVGLGTLEMFSEPAMVSNLHKAIVDELISQGWTESEVICADLIACGFFNISDLDTI